MSFKVLKIYLDNVQITLIVRVTLFENGVAGFAFYQSKEKLLKQKRQEESSAGMKCK